MIYYFLLVASIVLAVSKSALYNSYAKKSELTLFSIFRFHAISYSFAAVISLIGLLMASQTISQSTLVCAFFYAVIVIGLQTVLISAMSVGTMSTTSIFVMYGMIIPSISGPIFWKESVSALQIVGMLMMVISLWLIQDRTTGEKRTVAKKWLVLAVIAFLLSGMAGVMEKIHQSTVARGERFSFVFVACGFILLFALVVMGITRKKKVASTKSANTLALLSGLVVGGYSIINLTLAGGLDSMIYYPMANGGAMLMTVLVSAIFLKETFNRVKITGVIMGLAGILCLSMPV